MKHLLLPVFAILLSSCQEPYMNPGNDPYAPPYTSQQQMEMREQGRQINQMAFERGWQDGQMDAQRRQFQNYQLYRGSRFDSNTEMAYRDGYDRGYASLGGGLNPSGQVSPPYPPPGGGFQQPPPFPIENDTSYQQGYDYGVRARVAGRVADPAAHVGSYDPRKRVNFERGYHDGYNAHSRNGAPTQGGNGRLWNF